MIRSLIHVFTRNDKFDRNVNDGYNFPIKWKHIDGKF